MNDTPTPWQERGRWIVAILGLIALNVFLLGNQSGQCVDGPAGTASTCTVNPGAGTWFLVVVSLFAMAYCTHRLLLSWRR